MDQKKINNYLKKSQTKDKEKRDNEKFCTNELVCIHSLFPVQNAFRREKLLFSLPSDKSE